MKIITWNINRFDGVWDWYEKKKDKDTKYREKMAKAIRLAVEGGREAYLGKTGPVSNFANASSPLTGFLGSL